MNESVQQVVEKVERKRLREGLTQQAVAHRVGLTQSQYSRVSRGLCTPRADVLADMRSWLGAVDDHTLGGPIEATRLLRQIDQLRRDVREMFAMSGRQGSTRQSRKGRRPVRKIGSTAD